VKTVLGLSVTSAGVGWVLVDGTAAGGRPVDDDEFVVRDLDELVARCLAAVRGAQAIAASSGRPISAIGVCWSADVEDQVSVLLANLRAAGFGDVRSVRQVVPMPRGDSEHPVTEHPERSGLCGLLAGLLGDLDGGDEADPDDVADLVHHDVIAGPEAGQKPAYGAAQAVLTNAAPAESVGSTRARRTFALPTPGVPVWASPLAGARVMTMAAAAAVAAVIALVAVGSQFIGGTGAGQPGEATLAGRSEAAQAGETTAVVSSAPPGVQPLAAKPEPAPVVEEEPELSEPPVQLALPQPEPVQQPSTAVEPPVSAVALAVPQLPEIAPEAPVLPVADPVAPVAAPVPVDQAVPVAPAEVLPPAPPAPPPPFWLLPPFAPPPPPPPAPVPAEQLPAPAPAPAVNPVFGALP
jgi:hypothetical protein